ncbi:MAG: hypothetical protein COB49_02110 [Alphaproteobacteria bacterium]|nr:MAG: hypothetical protein COB49_02110 [Alphaproteobacteria bacterium]
MNPAREDCRRARAISEARHCDHDSRCPTASLLEDGDDFIGAVGKDVWLRLMPHDQKLSLALDERDRTGKRVVDTPLHAAIFACVLLGAVSGVVLMAGWV